MNLLLFRHAAAVDRDDFDGPDADRPLTPKGRRRFSRFVATLASNIDEAWYSPWRRAAETAALLRPIVHGPLRETELLAAAPTPALLACARGETAAFVGHEPWLGELLGLAVGGPPGLVRWRKGGLVWLVGEPRPGRMRIAAVLGPRPVRG